MSDARTSVLTWLIATLSATLIVAAPAVAQSAIAARNDSALHAIRRLDSLLAQRIAGRDSLARALMRQEWVDMTEGAFHVRTTPPLAERVREGARMASAAVAARGGRALRDRLARRLPIVRTDSQITFLGTDWVLLVASDTGRRSWEGRRGKSTGHIRAPEIADRLIALSERLALEGADSALTAWLMLEGVPLHDMPRTQWSDASVEMSMAPAIAARRCAARDADACLTSLGVFEEPTPLLQAWYAPSDYRALLAIAAVPRDDSSALANAARCRETADSTACTFAAQALPVSKIAMPFSSQTRQLFLEEALRAGGAGAYERLLSARGPMRERLAAVARMSLDSVVTRWLNRVEAARPDTMRAGPAVILATLAWCGVFMALAITRRGSWR